MTLVGSESDDGLAAGSRGIYQALPGPSYDSTEVTIRNMVMNGVDRGVYYFGECWGCLIYNCTITGNNEWSTSPVNFLGSNITWNDDGIHMPGAGNCAFNNTLNGFGDTFSYCGHSGNDNITESYSTHYYLNEIRNSCDDPIEVDHARRNCTWYDNRVHNAIKAALSSTLPGIEEELIKVNEVRS